MRELQAIVALAKEAEPGEMLALATVVSVRGSAYRRPGARMLMTAAGHTEGMISGGCLESDVCERARQVMATGRPRVVTYDSMAPEDIVFGLGLGCSGIVQVLIEPLTAGDEAGLLAFLTACQKSQQSGRIVTVFHAEGAAHDGAPGARLLQWPDGHITAGSSPPAGAQLLIDALTDVDDGTAVVRHIELASGGTLEVLVETIAPPTPLVIYGAGDDALPMAQFAKLLGWHVTVVDARPAYALPERFPMADAVICLRPDALQECPHLASVPDSLAIIMTHSYTQDRDLLRALLPHSLRYIGILGPKARTQRLLDELADEGALFSEQQHALLRGPAGLDIGAETPEEIALSVLAEMRAVLNHRKGGPLRERNSGIHDKDEG